MSLLQTNEQETVTSADIAAIISIFIMFIIMVNYFALPIHTLILKVFLFIDIYVGKVINYFLHMYDPRMEFVKKFDFIYKNYNNGYFQNIVLNIDMSFKNGIKMDLFNIVHNHKYRHAEYIFQHFYYLNAFIFGVFMMTFSKILTFKKDFDGTFFNNIPLIAFPEKIIKQKNRSGFANKIVTNDHMPPVNSSNSDYVSTSIKLSLLFQDKEWMEERKQKSLILNEMIEKEKTLDEFYKKLEKQEEKEKEKIKEINKSIVLEKDPIMKKLDKEDIISLTINKLKLDINRIEEELNSFDIKKEKAKNKTYLLIKEYLNLPIQINKRKLNVIEKNIKEKKRMKKRLTFVEEEVNRYLKLSKKTKKTKKELKIIKNMKKRYESNTEDFNPDYEEGNILTPYAYILNPKEGKEIFKKGDYKSVGSELIIELLKNNLLGSYEKDIQKKIDDILKNNNKLDKNDPNQSITYDLNMQIVSQLEQQLDNMDETSRLNSIKLISETHQFEETYLIGLWVYANTLSNMPTGPLSKLKKINPVLWFALTSINRPSFYLTGSPIYLMYEYEKQKINITGNKEEEIKFDTINVYMKETGLTEYLKEEEII